MRESLVRSTQYRQSTFTRRALGNLVALCRRQGIRLAFLLSPDLFYREYAPETRGHLDERVLDLSHELGVPLIDARDWSAPEDFHDGLHLTHAGAAAFTRRLERELGPYLAGQPFERLCPPGQGEQSLWPRGMAAK
jgi:hypothetical protein